MVRCLSSAQLSVADNSNTLTFWLHDRTPFDTVGQSGKLEVMTVRLYVNSQRWSWHCLGAARIV